MCKIFNNFLGINALNISKLKIKYVRLFLDRMSTWDDMIN